MQENLQITDRVTQQFLNKLAEAGGKPLFELTADEAREFFKKIQSDNYSYIPAEVTDYVINSPECGKIDIRFVRPEHSNEILPIILYFHGGGWVMGSKETHDMFIRKLAVCTNSVVVFVEYDRSPESVYPSALNQGYAVLKHLYENAEDFNIDSDRIVVGGDSAGGNLAAALALKTSVEGGPMILFQLLLYPVLDADMDSDSYKKFKDGPYLTRKAMEYFWDAYLPDKKLKNEIYVSPLKADLQTLAKMPPAIVVTAENDVLRDEGEAFAKKLDSAGVEAVSIRADMTIHDFLVLNALHESKPVQGIFSMICCFVSHKLHQ